MKTISVVLTNILLIINMNACKGQSNKNLNPIINHKITSTETLLKPNINVQVKKEFDSKGNLTRYDSSYSYVYTGSNVTIHDSLLPFKYFSGSHIGDFFNDNKGFFTGDSLLKKSIFEDDFFKKQSDLNKLLFDGLFPKMDSLNSNYPNDAQLRNGFKTL